jgi:hypothetical protein
MAGLVPAIHVLEPRRRDPKPPGAGAVNLRSRPVSYGQRPGLKVRVMEREIEIAQIKHDLEILRTRYAGYQRLTRILKSIAIAVGLILAIGALPSRKTN